jgi:PAS domain S-box-containing protein
MHASATDITEQRFRENERRTLFDALNASAITTKTDSRGIITEANDLFCKISGYSKDELIGKDHRILNSGHHSKEFFQKLWGTISKGKVWTGEIKNKAKDGSYYWVRTVIAPMTDFQNKVHSYFGIRFDITAEKMAEEENKFVLDALGLGIWRFNPITQELHWDKSMYSLYEMNPSEFSGHYQAWEGSLTAAAKEKAVEELGQALSGEKDFDTVFEINSKTKGKCYIGGRGKVIRDRAGKPLMMHGVNWDITKSKIVEESLAAKEKLLSAVLDNLPVAVFAKDIKRDFEWTIWNKHAEDLFGLKAKDCIGKFDKDLFPEDQAAFFKQKDIEASKSETIIDIPEETANTADGPVLLRTRKIVVRDSNNEPSILLGITENITEQKRQEQEREAHA